MGTVKTVFKKNFKPEPPRDKTNKMACAPSEDSDHTGWISAWASAQSDQSLLSA